MPPSAVLPMHCCLYLCQRGSEFQWLFAFIFGLFESVNFANDGHKLVRAFNWPHTRHLILESSNKHKRSYSDEDAAVQRSPSWSAQRYCSKHGTVTA